MSGFPKKALLIAGAITALFGVIVITGPVFTTEQNKEVAKIGDLKLTVKQETAHAIPPFVGPAALVIGGLLIAAALVVRH